MELRTRRLLLRPFRAEDREAFARFADDPAYWRFLGSNHPTAEQLVANNVALDWKNECSWVICLGDEVVGSIFLGIDAEDALGHLACMLSPAAWGQGIAGEAGAAVVNHAFADLGWTRCTPAPREETRRRGARWRRRAWCRKGCCGRTASTQAAIASMT